jgi:DNA-binding transcriptional LysR family regulator
MKISSFDLNLFVIMNSIYTEGSLTKAAEVVGITQPAVSNALSRLRDKFDDELFGRTGSGMVEFETVEEAVEALVLVNNLRVEGVQGEAEGMEFDIKLCFSRTFM